jgi:superfamily II DNA or RNA helicase
MGAKLYVPRSLVQPWHLEEFTYRIKEEMEMLDGSKENVWVPINLWQEHYNYYSFHRGDIQKLINLWPEMLTKGNLVDHRANPDLPPELKNGLKLIDGFEYRTYPTDDPQVFSSQYDALMALINPNLGGILRAFPAFGKTVMMTLLIMSQKKKFLLIAHKADLLDQFEATVRALTNIDAFRDPDGECWNMYRLNKAWPAPPIATTTFAYLMANPEYLHQIRDEYAMVGVDECHHIGGDGYTTCLLHLNAYFRYGFTATDYRKDGMDMIFPDILGPVRYDAPRPPLTIEAEVIHTGFKLPSKLQYVSQKMLMNHVHNYVAADPDRNKLIARKAIEDMLAGHIVLIMVFRITAIDNIYAALEAELAECVRFNREFPIHISQIEWMYSDFKMADRDEVRARLEDGVNPDTEGGSKCLITTQHLFGEGSNYPALSCLHWTFPSSNEKDVAQNIGRIMRVHPHKLSPQKIRFYQDGGVGQVMGIGKSWVRKTRAFGVRVYDPKEAEADKVGTKLNLKFQA